MLSELTFALDWLLLVVLTYFLVSALKALLGLVLIIATPLLQLLPGFVIYALLLDICQLIVPMRFPNFCPFQQYFGTGLGSFYRPMNRKC